MQDGERLNVDVWSAKYGLKLGEYARSFNQSCFKAVFL